MKYFTLTNKKFNGLLKYLDKFNNVEYTANGEATNDPFSYVVKNALNANVWVELADGSKFPSYIQFHLKNYKAIITNYQFSTVINTSPPYNWVLEGSTGFTTNENNDGEWITISAPNPTENLCEYESKEIPQCTNQNIVQFDVNQTIGPFKTFRFKQIKSRYNIFMGSTKSDIRLSGFELYGILYKDYEKFYKITCKKTNNLVKLTFIFIQILCL